MATIGQAGRSAADPQAVLERAGLPGAEAAQVLAATDPPHAAGYEAAASSASEVLLAIGRLLGRLRVPGARPPAERAAGGVLVARASAIRTEFLDVHAASLYDAVTDRRRRALRVETLVVEAGRRVPGLVPTAEELAAERARPLGEKEGLERAHGELLGSVLGLPEAGTHLIESMLRPTEEALSRLGEFRDRGALQLGPMSLRREGTVGVIEQCNTDYLNAEDETTLGPLEVAIDLVLLDDDLDVGVLRGGPVERPGYANGRVFGSGLNLTELYLGRIGYLFFVVRDLGLVNKLYRGLLGVVRPGLRKGAGLEKLWVAAVESYAVGGACQLLHVVDHVLAARGARLFLPARKEGIVPGASNLRLPRFVGDRAARQAILSGREWTAGDADAAALCDEVVDPDQFDVALSARVAAITDSGLVNAAANRRALREGEEPLDVFRSYMAGFALDMTDCYLSPVLVRNLERHWLARARRS